MSDPDLMKLYSTRLLALAADIPLVGTLDAPQARGQARSPMCGSTVSVTLDAPEGRITRFAQDVQACALGQASAAVLGGLVIGQDRVSLARAREEIAVMLKGGAAPQPPFSAWEALLPARDYPNRHASVLLALDATLSALAEIAAGLTRP